MHEKPTALITGAGRGIGRGIALALAGAGYAVAGCDIVFEPENVAGGLFEVQAAAAKLGTEFLPLRCDVSDLDGHAGVLDAVLKKFGRLDVLVNNAGVSPEVRRDILETTPASYDRVMSINARGAFFLTQKAVPFLLETASAAGKAARPRIVFVTSISAEISSPSRAEYCVSKAALSMTARLFADRLAATAVRVYEVRPGIIRTDMTLPVVPKYDKLIAEGIVPQMRWGLPEDVGRAVAALVSGGFEYSTGFALEVSGGMNIRRL